MGRISGNYFRCYVNFLYHLLDHSYDIETDGERPVQASSFKRLKRDCAAWIYLCVTGAVLGALAVNRAGSVYYPDRSSDLFLLSGEGEMERVWPEL